MVATATTHNVAKDAPEVAEVNNLIAKLRELNAAKADDARNMVRTAWTESLADAEYLRGVARTLRGTIGDLRTFAQRQPGQPAKVTEDRLPAGRYAVDTNEDAANRTAFYVVKWWDGRNGRMFSMYRMVGGHDDVRLPYGQALTIAGRIFDQGVEESERRYGRETEICGRCGIQLTDDRSRAAGYGEKCAKARGYAW